MNEKIKVLGVSINHYTAKEAMKKVMEYMETEPINVIEMVTMNTLSQLLNKEEKPYIDEFDLTFAGDKSILEAAGVTDSKYLNEAKTLLFVKMVMRFLHKSHKKVFLLAEDEEALAELREYVTGKYSGIVISETATMEEHWKSDDMIVNRINGAETDCIFAALPSPLQEEVILRNRTLLNARIWFGMGTGLKERRRTGFGRRRLKAFFTQHIVKKKIEKERKQNQNL